MFLVPILLVAGISISHVVSWYTLSNPFNWAIYLSIAIEVGAMISLIAATKKIKGGVWFMFGLVTLIQLIGNIFYSYVHIEDSSDLFIKWMELTNPLFDMISGESITVLAHKRWLALLEGGLLPLISLTALHFYSKYEEPTNDQVNDQVNDEVNDQVDEVDEDAKDTDVVNIPETKSEPNLTTLDDNKVKISKNEFVNLLNDKIGEIDEEDYDTQTLNEVEDSYV